MLTPDEFWGDNIYQSPALTDEMISIAETTLSVRLPQEYLELLRYQNGGLTRGFYLGSRDHVELESLNGIIPDVKLANAFNLMDSQYLIDEWGLPKNQVIISGDGHWWISLDYRQKTEPDVVYLWSEGGETDNENAIQLPSSLGIIDLAWFQKAVDHISTLSD